MDLHDAVQSRHMVRSFSPRPVPRATLARMLRDALRAPTAGNAGATAWVVLEGRDQTMRYWDAATSLSWRTRARRWPGLSKAPVVALAVTHPAAYVSRYAEPDKVRDALDDRLGSSEAAWPVPYWFGDAAFSVMTLLLGAVSEGLGGCFLGNFRSEEQVLAQLGVPEGWRLFGAVLLGYPDGDDPRSASLDRPVPGFAERVHFGRWAAGDDA